MKIFLPSAAIKAKIVADAKAAEQAALREWHKVFVWFARVSDTEVHFFETIERRLAADIGKWEFRSPVAATPVAPTA